MQKREIIKIEMMGRLPAKLCLYVIRFYQLFVSPLKPQVCRFYPTCSQYCYDAIKKYGMLKGITMGIRRLLCCHPFHPGGYDPVK